MELVAILPRSRSTHVPNDSDMDSDSSSGYSGLREEHVVKASALLRLYCALMGIAGLRYATADTYRFFKVKMGDIATLNHEECFTSRCLRC